MSRLATDLGRLFGRRIEATSRGMDVDSLMGMLSSRFGQVKVSGGRNGTELLTECPFCGHQYKLSVNGGKGVFHCWHCGESGSLRTLLGKDVVVRPEAVRKPVEPRGPVYPPSVDEGGLVSLSCLPDDNPAVVYVTSRGFDPDELGRDFAMSYCRNGRKFMHVPFDASNTLVIPVYASNALIGWQARLLYDPKKVSDEVLEAMGYVERKTGGELKRPPKYLTSPGLGKGSILYNSDWARNYDTVVVTEGVFDCVRVGRQGVATFGKTVSSEQKRMLSSLWKTVVLLLDPDAEEDQNRLAAELERPGGPRIVKVSLRGYKDAGDCPRDELWRQIGDALNS